MTPYNKFHGCIITITTMIMYIIWGYVGSIRSENIVIVTIVGGVSTYGTYKIVNKIIGLIFNNFMPVKKIILGKYYLDGVWVGVYIGSNNQPIYYVENYYQDFDKFIIKGRCYYDNYSYKGSWDSENVILDIDKNKLIYNYYTDMSKNNFINTGQAVFNINRDENGKTATRLIGYSQDLFSTEKFKSVEAKYCDGHKIKLDRFKSDKEIINKASELYDSYKEFLQDN